MPCRRGIFIAQQRYQADLRFRNTAQKSRLSCLAAQKAAFIVLFQEQRALRKFIPAGPLRSPESARRSGRGCAAGQTGVFLIVLHHYIIVSILSQVRHYFEDSLLVFLLRASLLCSYSLVQYVTAFSRQKVTVSFQMLPSRNFFTPAPHTLSNCSICSNIPVISFKLLSLYRHFARFYLYQFCRQHFSILSY